MATIGTNDSSIEALRRVVALYDGEMTETLVDLPRARVAAVGTLGLIPFIGSMIPGAFLGSLLSFADAATTISFSGGILVALKFLREARSSLDAYLQAKAKRKVVIKANGISIEVHGSDDIDRAILAYSQLSVHNKSTNPPDGAKETRPSQVRKANRKQT